MPDQLMCKLVAEDPKEPGKESHFESIEAIESNSLDDQIQEDKKYGKLIPHNGELWVQLRTEDEELTRGQFRKGAWSSMLEWEHSIDVDFKRVHLEDTPDVKIMFRTSEQDQLFKNEPNVLAYMYYPIASPTFRGLCVINADFPWTVDGSVRSGKWMKQHGINVQNEDFMYQTWSLFKVIRHELGHGVLGLPHSKLNGQTMSPSYGQMALHNTVRDEKRGQAKLGVSTRSHRWKNSMKRILNRWFG